jgi:hypothetical protein
MSKGLLIVYSRFESLRKKFGNTRFRIRRFLSIPELLNSSYVLEAMSSMYPTVIAKSSLASLCLLILFSISYFSSTYAFCHIHPE